MNLKAHHRVAALCVLAVAMSGCSLFRSKPTNPPAPVETSVLPSAVNTNPVTVDADAPVRCSDSELAALFAGNSAAAQAARIYHFGTDSSDLNNDATTALGIQAKVISAHPEVRILLTGHTDERGTHDYNLALGERRGNAVARYLSSVGVNGDQIKVTSYGKEKPIAQGSNEAAWAQNRRVELNYMSCKTAQ